MLYRLLAGITVAAHLGFVLFVGSGGLLVLRWRRLAWLHVPAAVYGVAIELGGWVCPLTPLENYFRRLGAESGYRGGFLKHYVLPLLYPARLTPHVSDGLALGVLALNLLIYAWVYRRARRRMT